jgi:hypothetical protein
MKLDSIQVVEYSVNQGAYHLHSLADMLRTNNESVMADKHSDYLPIAMFRSDIEADNFIAWHRRKMERRKRIDYKR